MLIDSEVAMLGDSACWTFFSDADTPSAAVPAYRFNSYLTEVLQ